MKRRIKMNAAGNWVGYEGRSISQEFGTDRYFAFFWLRTGLYDWRKADDLEENKITDSQWMKIRNMPGNKYIKQEDIQ